VKTCETLLRLEQAPPKAQPTPLSRELRLPQSTEDISGHETNRHNRQGHSQEFVLGGINFDQSISR